MRNRLNNLKDRWARCQTLHADIKASATSQERANHPYFEGDTLSTVEDAYLAASDFLSETLDELVKPISASTLNINSSTTSEYNSVSIPLPRINLPKFSG